jgi:hypothetical protein
MQSKEETKQEIKKDVVIPIKKEIIKIESGVFQHPEHGKLLFKPDDEFEMRTCCGVTSCDKPLMEFLAKTIVSLSVLTFCFIQLSKGSQSEFASSTISLILGTYLGSTGAAMNKNKKER